MLLIYSSNGDKTDEDGTRERCFVFKSLPDAASVSRAARYSSVDRLTLRVRRLLPLTRINTYRGDGMWATYDGGTIEVRLTLPKPLTLGNNNEQDTQFGVLYGRLLEFFFGIVHGQVVGQFELNADPTVYQVGVAE